MASSTPTPEVEARPQPTVAPPVQVPWWREWLKPIVVVAVISVLVGATTLVANVGMTASRSLKADNGFPLSWQRRNGFDPVVVASAAHGTRRGARVTPGALIATMVTVRDGVRT